MSASYVLDSAFADSTSGPVSVVVQAPPVTDGPRVTEVKRRGCHTHPTVLALVFDRALDGVYSENLENYRLVAPNGKTIKLRFAKYLADVHAVVLAPTRLLPLKYHYRLTVVGTPPEGARDTNGVLLDGAGDGKPGSDFVTTITRDNLVIPSGAVRSTAARRNR